MSHSIDAADSQGDTGTGFEYLDDDGSIQATDESTQAGYSVEVLPGGIEILFPPGVDDVAGEPEETASQPEDEGDVLGVLGGPGTQPEDEGDVLGVLGGQAPDDTSEPSSPDATAPSEASAADPTADAAGETEPTDDNSDASASSQLEAAQEQAVDDGKMSYDEFANDATQASHDDYESTMSILRNFSV